MLEPTELAQLESEGKPVLSNTFLALKHCSTQANLCTDEQQLLTKFGMEHEVSCVTTPSALNHPSMQLLLDPSLCAATQRTEITHSCPRPSGDSPHG